MPISEAIISVKWIRPSREEGCLLQGLIVPRYRTASFWYVDVVVVSRRRLHSPTCYSADCFFVLIQSIDVSFFLFFLFFRAAVISSRNIGTSMASRSYFDRIRPRRNLGGFYTGSLSSLNDVNTYSLTMRKLVRISIYSS